MKKITLALLLPAVLIITATHVVNAQRITVSLAGNGTAGYSGDGGSDKIAMVNMPHDICTDAAQNIYFSDSGNGRIRKLSAANGLVTTIAGGGSSTADGVPALSALLSPRNICIDATGNLYVVSSNQIKRIDAVTNIITTVAGTGAIGFSGDGGLAISATFNGIFGICIDIPGNIYLVDQLNNRVRKIDAGTGIITTIAGTGAIGFTGDGAPATAALLSSPETICINASTGDVYFSDQGGGTYESRIRKISASTGFISTVAGTTVGGGELFDVLSLNAWLGEVTGLCIDGSGNLYCNEISCSCRRMDMRTDSIYPVAGNFSIESYSDNVNSILSYMNNPYGLCTDAAQNLYVADKFNNRIRKIIQLTHTPTFAYGRGESFYTCPGAVTPIDTQLAITDLDSMQAETWTVVSVPMHGTLSGFPATAFSLATASITTPSGTAYIADASYSGSDSFQVQVSDGALTSIVTIYVSSAAGAIAGPNNICVGSTISLGDEVVGGTWTMTNSNATISSSGVVTGVLAGSDIAIYAVTNSCGLMTTEQAVTIDLAAPATAGAITGPVSVCASVPTAFTDAVAGGVWRVTNSTAAISASGVITGITAGSDSVVYTVANACGLTSTASVITIDPHPDAGTIAASEVSVCIGASITVTDAAGGGSGAWSSSNAHAVVTSAGLVTGIATGATTIQYAVTNSCGTATATQDITVTDCSVTGIQTASSTPVINIFPNPASSVLSVQWEALQTGNAGISITDVTGRVVLRTELLINANGSQDLDVSELKEGIYMVAINSGSIHFTDKVVISK